MRRRSRLHHKLLSIMDITKVTDRSTDEDSSDFSDSDSSSSTTIPSWNGTWFNRTHYRLTRTRGHGTTHSIMGSSSTRPRTTTHIFGTTSKGQFSNTSLGQTSSTVSFPVGLLAIFASLAGFVLVLLVFITYFGYVRKRRWRNANMPVASNAVTAVEEGITNHGYEEVCVEKVKAIDRLSIIPECAEEQEYEYVDPDKLSVNRHWRSLATHHRHNDYEYEDPDNSAAANVNSNAAVGEEYEYVDPDKTSNHKLSNLPKIVISPEDFEYVDPGNAAGSDEESSAYQDMVPTGLDQHVYADSRETDDSGGTDDSADQEIPPEYDDINTEQPAEESLAVDNPAYQLD